MCDLRFYCPVGSIFNIFSFGQLRKNRHKIRGQRNEKPFKLAIKHIKSCKEQKPTFNHSTNSKYRIEFKSVKKRKLKIVY